LHRIYWLFGEKITQCLVIFFVTARSSKLLSIRWR